MSEAAEVKQLQWPIKAHARAIVKSLREHPESWQFGEFHATRKGISMWTANGAMSLSLEGGNNPGLNFAEKLYIMAAIRKAKREKIVSMLRDE